MQQGESFADKVSGKIEEVKTGILLETLVFSIKPVDLKTLLKKKGWNFNWRKEFNYKFRKIYKLVIKGDTKIQGIISIEPVPDQKYIELHLIETAPHNYGRSKKYQGVPGNLVAFACRKSFEMGFEGFVGFLAKSKLIQHYMDSLGAELMFRNRMIITTKSAKKLVNLYYKDVFDEA